MAVSIPHIITIKLDTTSHTYLTELRNKYFPAHCNYLDAHLTLFHNLPNNTDAIEDILQKFSNRSILNLKISGIKNITNGVVFTIESDDLQKLHKTMQRSLKSYLVTKDRKRLWPHITIQNKVTAYKAKLTTEILKENFSPFSVQGIGFSSFLFVKGPWQHQKDYLFNNNQ
jgi:2'-5' RNA ligase